jgi:hypothetical protein
MSSGGVDARGARIGVGACASTLSRSQRNLDHGLRRCRIFGRRAGANHAIGPADAEIFTNEMKAFAATVAVMLPRLNCVGGSGVKADIAGLPRRGRGRPVTFVREDVQAVAINDVVQQKEGPDHTSGGRGPPSAPPVRGEVGEIGRAIDRARTPHRPSRRRWRLLRSRAIEHWLNCYFICRNVDFQNSHPAAAILALPDEFSYPTKRRGNKPLDLLDLSLANERPMSATIQTTQTIPQ